MIAILKRFKILYSIYNFFHRKELYHNKALFKNLGLRKKYYSPLSSKDFKNIFIINEPIITDKQKFNVSKVFNTLPNASKESLLSFRENGFAVLRNYLSDCQVDDINSEIEMLIQKKRIKFNNRNKIMMAIRVSKLLQNIGNQEGLKEILSILLDGNAILFQSINFLMGSEQSTHSDSIHMTTFPLGGLLGVWIALEDITEENGPLHYYPHSHTLPYYLNADYKNEGNALFLGAKSYKDYEKMIAEKISEQKLEKVKFFARKGDLLIWHANLFHGGEPHLNKQKTRKSMVLHYFKENSICYHEITQRPALMQKYQ
ncbi:MAG TPA: phytanoyl-CoA dioxygenase family protein [Flavisolibacter sp.]|nr:phytanoyl-CoA dioxygenase family protein [Flavisolibacter sp.]